MATAIERRVSGAVRQQAEVPNAHEPGRHDMEQEPPEKLVNRQGHDFAAIDLAGIVAGPQERLYDLPEEVKKEAEEAEEAEEEAK